jgi:hypothetical protein
MKDNFREYHNIKFFRGKKRKNSEMQRLSEARLDFEFRTLLIEESELDLHVYFSRMTVYNWLSWSFLALAFSFLQYQTISIILLGLALIARIFSFINKRRFQFVFRSYNFALAILDMVIKREHGLSLP